MQHVFNAFRAVIGALGHSSPMVTMTVYAHVLPGSQREAFARLIREAGGA